MNIQKRGFLIFLASVLIVSPLSAVSANELEEAPASEQQTVVANDGQTEEESVDEVMDTTSENAQELRTDQNSIPQLEDSLNETNSQLTETTPVESSEEAEQAPVTKEEMVLPYTAGKGKIIQSTPYYSSSSKGLIQAGALEVGLILFPTKVTKNYFIVTSNNISYYIPKSALTSTTEIVTLEKHIKGNYARDIVAEKNVPFTDKAGNVLGTIAKGQKVKLHMVNGGKGVIELFGKRVYVSLNHFNHTNQVLPEKNISHHEMEYHLKVFSYMYPEFTELVQIGSSVEGRKIYALKVGKGEKEILMDASMHAREHMTTNVLLEMIDTYTYHYLKGTKFSSYNVRSVLNDVSIWFVPMMNPDAVTLVQSKANATPTTKKLNNGSTNYNRWKSNIRGVDLNHNFSIGWDELVTVNKPSYKFYKGPKAFSEPESRALRDFMAKHPFKSYISYHSSGQVLYYFNFQNAANLKRDRALAKEIYNVTGYSLMPPSGRTASGVSADYFISTYKKPGITVEIAPYGGESVVPLKYWNNVWKKNKTIGLLAASEASLR